ncbi:hypothetical protein [Hymenobacter wooponensis]|uniref:Uncharacterized protein n=1 Tax=Hymenobacter wooponensis TaxID=1525360 RepID=A0A4Z0MDI9_9BACT|nr:hypothetical protein [Hymenobacter wooponensis]TGD77813.1 hypothetical protein EU557_21195 [Hymenobacter wooponensis]
MKAIATIAGLFLQVAAYGQQSASISFKNDYADVYHLSLIIYTPDGQNQTRVSNLNPGDTKAYSLPVGSEIYVADNKQEAFAMKGNDIKATGLKPRFVLAADERISLTSLALNTGGAKKKD